MLFVVLCYFNEMVVHIWYYTVDCYIYLGFSFGVACGCTQEFQVSCIYESIKSRQIVLKCYTNNDPENYISLGLSVHVTTVLK